MGSTTLVVGCTTPGSSEEHPNSPASGVSSPVAGFAGVSAGMQIYQAWCGRLCSTEPCSESFSEK